MIKMVVKQGSTYGLYGRSRHFIMEVGAWMAIVHTKCHPRNAIHVCTIAIHAPTSMMKCRLRP